MSNCLLGRASKLQHYTISRVILNDSFSDYQELTSLEIIDCMAPEIDLPSLKKLRVLHLNDIKADVVFTKTLQLLDWDSFSPDGWLSHQKKLPLLFGIRLYFDFRLEIQMLRELPQSLQAIKIVSEQEQTLEVDKYLKTSHNLQSLSISLGEGICVE